jgi:hypothetical protein
VLRLYRQAASPEFFDRLGAELKLHFHNGVYSLAVVIWRMIVQRLHPQGTLVAVVQEAVRQPYLCCANTQFGSAGSV